MKLSEFITETVKEIIEGTIAAQQHSTRFGAKVNHPDLIVKANNQLHRLATVTGDQIAHEVEFNVAVCVPNHDDPTVEDRENSIYVGAMGKNKYEHSKEPDVASCRLHFSIPIALPLQKK